LGSAVNTIFDEDGPFLDHDGKTLYFSSKDRIGMGGYDIYKVVYDSVSRRWGGLVNLGYPINTTADDIFFVHSKVSKRAYSSSTRKGGYGGLDIYEVIFNEDWEEGERDLLRFEPVRLQVEVFETGNKLPVEATIELRSIPEEGVINGMRTRQGEFEFLINNTRTSNYRIEVIADGYRKASVSIRLPGASDQPATMTRSIFLQKMSQQ
jgi:hypothetical protein